MPSIKDSGGMFESLSEKFLIDSLGSIPKFGRGIDGDIAVSQSFNINTQRIGFPFTGQNISGLDVITNISSLAGLIVGSKIYGTGFALGTKILSLVSTPASKTGSTVSGQ